MLDTLRRDPAIAEAEGGIFDPGGTILGTDGKPISTGGGGAPEFVAGVHAVRRFEGFQVVTGRMPATPRDVALDKATADREGIEVGEVIGVQAVAARTRYRVSGIVRISGVDSFGGASVALLTLPEAQRLTGKRGRFDEVDAAVRPGADAGEVVRRLRAALPRTVEVRTGTEQAAESSRQIRDNLGFLRTALLAFAGISLFVGAFIIFNTFSITVAQRTRELALLRTLGASRRQVLAAVLGEGALLGVTGAAAGLALGVLVAGGLRALFKAIGADLPSNGSVVLTRTVVVSLLVGVLVTLLASLAPALRATRVAPIAAMREGAVLPPSRHARLTTRSPRCSRSSRSSSW